jgi:hypothetical protein
VGGQSAVRQGDWKLVSHAGQPAELYHLAGDIGESRDLRVREPGRLKALRESLVEWNGQIKRPAWQAEARPKSGAPKAKK